MANNIVIRQLGPVVEAFNRARNAIASPQKPAIAGLDRDLWPNPLQPVTPMGPSTGQPMGWQMPWGQNLVFTPRNDAEYSAAYLRRLATYPLARICIDNNKDILTRMPWKIQLKPIPGETSKDHASRSKKDPNLAKLNKFFERPSWDKDWSEFWRPVIDDMLVLDAATVYLDRTVSGEILELKYISGESITCLVDSHGWTPRPPSIAYQQIWQGFPRGDYTTNQLVYRPRNIVPRNTNSSYLYGMSPTEAMAKEIEIGWDRLQFVKDYYTEGSVPGAMIFAPVGTPPEKIKEAQQFIDSDLAGQLAKRRRLQILQGFQKEGQTEQLEFPKEPALTDAFDEAHLRKIAFAYGTSPVRLMKMMNRSSSQQTQEAAEEEGTLPWLDWFKGFVNYILQIQMKMVNYEISFDPFQELDSLKRSMADSEDIKIGLYTRNEKRRDRGDDPRPEPEADELNTMTASGVLPLGKILDKGPAAPTSGKGGGVPKGGAQPKATASVNATSSSRAGKTNGHAEWAACKKHQGSYPRAFCSDCLLSAKVENEIIENQEVEI